MLKHAVQIFAFPTNPFHIRRKGATFCLALAYDHGEPIQPMEFKNIIFIFLNSIGWNSAPSPALFYAQGRGVHPLPTLGKGQQIKKKTTRHTKRKDVGWGGEGRRGAGRQAEQAQSNGREATWSGAASGQASEQAERLDLNLFQ